MQCINIQKKKIPIQWKELGWRFKPPLIYINIFRSHISNSIPNWNVDHQLIFSCHNKSLATTIQATSAIELVKRLAPWTIGIIYQKSINPLHTSPYCYSNLSWHPKRKTIKSVKILCKILTTKSKCLVSWSCKLDFRIDKVKKQHSSSICCLKS